jgi:hypothetical protein
METESVVLTGKVFEIGDYEDRGFSISPEEMDQAITEFKPVANDLEHSRLRDVLGNSLGELRRLWRVGQDVFGEVVVPKWLADLTGNVLKVSLAFNRERRVVGNALTLSPRIGDAEVVAAFSRQAPKPFSLRGFLFGKGGRPVNRERAATLAARFADDAVRSKKFLPMDRPYLQKAFEAALIADGLIAFAEDGIAEGEASEALRKMVEERPEHGLEEENLDGVETRVLLPGDGISEERKAELLNKTDLGREVAKVRKSGARAPGVKQ